MKFIYFLFLLTSFSSISISAQYYNSELTNKEISKFFCSLNKSKDTKIGLIEEKIWAWNHSDLFGSIDSNIYRYDSKIGILKNDTLTKYLTKDDLCFIEKQFMNLYEINWRSEDFSHFSLFGDQIINQQHYHRDQMRNNKALYYSFSIPLFSLNKKYVVIKEGINVGIFSCTYNCLYYRENLMGKWRMIYLWNRYSI